jgi:hypothetical protein
MTGSAKQSMSPHNRTLDCFVADAPRNDGNGVLWAAHNKNAALPPRFCFEMANR